MYAGAPPVLQVQAAISLAIPTLALLYTDLALKETNINLGQVSESHVAHLVHLKGLAT